MIILKLENISMLEPIKRTRADNQFVIFNNYFMVIYEVLPTGNLV